MFSFILTLAATRRTASKWSAFPLFALVFLGTGCDEQESEPQFYEGVTIGEGAVYVSARRWQKRGLEWLVEEGGTIRLQREVPAIADLDRAHEATIMVHGYHAPPRTIALCFAGLVSHLTDSGYRHPVVVFDWPSTAELWQEISLQERLWYMEATGVRNPGLSWELAGYSGDLVTANSTAADALIGLLETLSSTSPDARFNIIAHSMGCVVVFQAIRRRPELAKTLRDVFWLAPSLEAEKLDDAEFRNGLRQVGRLSVYHSLHDGLLGLLATATFSPRLGHTGPGTTSALPRNLTAYDLSDALGQTGVHSKYLEKDGPAAVSISNALAGERRRRRLTDPRHRNKRQCSERPFRACAFLHGRPKPDDSTARPPRPGSRYRKGRPVEPRTTSSAGNSMCGIRSPADPVSSR